MLALARSCEFDTRHVPAIAKHPVLRLRPLANVELATVPVTFKNVACNPEVNVDVAPELKVKALLLPLMESAAALTAAKIDVLPHQIVLVHRLATAAPRRYLVADEVGLGKTVTSSSFLLFTSLIPNHDREPVYFAIRCKEVILTYTTSLSL